MGREGMRGAGEMVLSGIRGVGWCMRSKWSGIGWSVVKWCVCVNMEG